MKLRQCFKCGKELDYENYIKNINPNEISSMTKIWNSEFIELYCCNCYCFKIKYQTSIDYSQELNNNNFLKRNINQS